MGSCCCCCASRTTELTTSPPYFHYPQSEEHEPLSANHAAVSTLSTGLLVDTNLDISVLDTYRSPPAPIPYESYVGNPITPSRNHEISGNKSEVALYCNNTESSEHTNADSTLTKVKNLQTGEKEEVDFQEVEDEKFDDIKKSAEPIIPPLLEEDCPICLEEYDEENPKFITDCDHHFHLACILEWTERSDVCPVCDKVIPTIEV